MLLGTEDSGLGLSEKLAIADGGEVDEAALLEIVACEVLGLVDVTMIVDVLSGAGDEAAVLLEPRTID